MCNQEDAKRLIKEAEEFENIHSAKARRNYLEAAEINLLLSTNEKGNEKEAELILEASSLFSRAQELKGKEEKISYELSFNPENFMDKPKTTFKDIGGLEELKDEIRFKIIEPFKNPEIFRHFGKKIGGGILMYGPPGCGKSLIAEAAANEAEASFFHVKASDLKSKWVGETEKNIAELFIKARKSQPSIIFFDEFEALGSDRTEAQFSFDRNVVAQLLTEMDGVGTKNQKILLLAATNEPWSIDPALLREGRFGMKIFIPAPDKEARKGILKLNLKNKPLEKDVSIQRISELTESFSGADISALCDLAADIPLREYFKSKKLRKIKMKDFMDSMRKVKSVVPRWFEKAAIQLRKQNLGSSFEELVSVQAESPFK